MSLSIKYKTHSKARTEWPSLYDFTEIFYMVVYCIEIISYISKVHRRLDNVKSMWSLFLHPESRTILSKGEELQCAFYMEKNEWNITRVFSAHKFTPQQSWL